MSAFVVLVADTEIDPHGQAEPHIVGPFDSHEAATDYAYTVDRYLVHVLPLTNVQQAAAENVAGGVTAAL